MSRIRKTALPFRWNTVNISFTQGTANTVNLATFVQNQQNRALTYSVIGTLPTGVSLAGAVVSYNGVGAAAASTVQFRITDGTHTAESAQTTVAIAVAQTANTAPVWKSNTPTSLGTYTAGTGGTFDLSAHAFDAEGDAIRYYRTGGTTDTAPGTVTVNETTGLVTIPSSLSAGSYSVAVRLAGNSAQADWLARSTDSSVVWAHNFEHQQEVLNFLINPNGHNDPAGTWAAANYPLNVRHGTDGIAGGGCLEMEVLAADVAYARDPTRPYSRGSWIRPYSPLLTDSAGVRTTGSGTGQTDRGASLVPGGAKVWRPATVARAAQDFRAGVYGHTDYKTATNALGQNRGEAAGWIWEGDQSTGFYVQCRIKIPAERFTPTRVIPANGQVYPSGDPLAGQTQTFWNNSTQVTAPKQGPCKVMWWAHAPSNLASFTTPAHEIVQTGNGKQAYNTSTHQARMYSGQNASFDVVNNLSGSVPTGTSPTVPLPWEWPADKWVTVLMYVKPGHFSMNNEMSGGPNGAMFGGDTTVRFWAAYDGSDYVFLGGSDVARLWAYNGASDDTGPLGWNAIVPTNYANGGEFFGNDPTTYRNPLGETACTQTYSVKFTQMIFSRAWIPPPAVGA
jgi:hypothetical protein